MSDKPFQLMTPSETLSGTQGKSYWLCSILIDGEEYGVKIQFKRTGRSSWYVQLYTKSRCSMNIPFPAIERDQMNNLECALLVLDYVKASDQNCEASIVKVGGRHSERKSAEPKADKFTRKLEIEKPWSDADRALQMQIEKINRVRYKTALQERNLAALEARLKADPSRWLVGMGVGYRVSRNQINRGFRIKKTNFSEKTVLVTSVHDSGLTTTGGDFDRISDRWVYVSDLIRDKRFDSADGFSV